MLAMTYIGRVKLYLLFFCCYYECFSLDIDIFNPYINYDRELNKVALKYLFFFCEFLSIYPNSFPL